MENLMKIQKLGKYVLPPVHCIHIHMHIPSFAKQSSKIVKCSMCYVPDISSSHCITRNTHIICNKVSSKTIRLQLIEDKYKSVMG